MPRAVLGIVIALLVGAAYLALLYAFFTHLWPLLPLWANIVVVVLLALGVILSPLFLLLRLGGMPPPHA